MRPASGPLAVFGDETLIGLGYALSAECPTRPAALHFELDDMDAGRHVLKHLDLSGVALFEKRTDEEHFEQMAAVLPSLAAAGASFVFAGKAETVRRLRQSKPINMLALRAQRFLGRYQDMKIDPALEQDLYGLCDGVREVFAIVDDQQKMLVEPDRE